MLGTVIEDDMFTAGAQHASFFAGALAEKLMTNQSGLLNLSVISFLCATALSLELYGMFTLLISIT
jgi:hypothetical protein